MGGFGGDLTFDGEKSLENAKKRLILCVEKTRSNLFKIHKKTSNFDDCKKWENILYSKYNLPMPQGRFYGGG